MTLMSLHEYEVSTPFWSPNKKIRPLAELATSHILTWYEEYNEVKHNRYLNFKYATLENLYNGVCSLIVILAAQFPNVIGDLTTNGYLFLSNNEGALSFGDITIEYPAFTDAEKYYFDWDILKTTPQPFDQYPF